MGGNDRFDASWTSIEKKEGQSLKQLKSIATVRSVGSSTRIAGSKMSKKEVEVLLKEIDITKIEDRDSQEVVEYFETLDLISESYDDIEINESGSHIITETPGIFYLSTFSSLPTLTKAATALSRCSFSWAADN